MKPNGSGTKENLTDFVGPDDFEDVENPYLQAIPEVPMPREPACASTLSTAKGTVGSRQNKYKYKCLCRHTPSTKSDTYILKGYRYLAKLAVIALAATAGWPECFRVSYAPVTTPPIRCCSIASMAACPMTPELIHPAQSFKNPEFLAKVGADGTQTRRFAATKAPECKPLTAYMTAPLNPIKFSPQTGPQYPHRWFPPKPPGPVPQTLGGLFSALYDTMFDAFVTMHFLTHEVEGQQLSTAAQCTLALDHLLDKCQLPGDAPQVDYWRAMWSMREAFVAFEKQESVKFIPRGTAQGTGGEKLAFPNFEGYMLDAGIFRGVVIGTVPIEHWVAAPDPPPYLSEFVISADTRSLLRATSMSDDLVTALGDLYKNRHDYLLLDAFRRVGLPCDGWKMMHFMSDSGLISKDSNTEPSFMQLAFEAECLPRWPKENPLKVAIKGGRKINEQKAQRKKDKGFLQDFRDTVNTIPEHLVSYKPKTAEGTGSEHQPIRLPSTGDTINQLEVLDATGWAHWFGTSSILLLSDNGNSYHQTDVSHVKALYESLATEAATMYDVCVFITGMSGREWQCQGPDRFDRNVKDLSDLFTAGGWVVLDWGNFYRSLKVNFPCGKDVWHFRSAGNADVGLEAQFARYVSCTLWYAKTNAVDSTWRPLVERLKAANGDSITPYQPSCAAPRVYGAGKPVGLAAKVTSSTFSVDAPIAALLLEGSVVRITPSDTTTYVDDVPALSTAQGTEGEESVDNPSGLVRIRIQVARVSSYIAARDGQKTLVPENAFVAGQDHVPLYTEDVRDPALLTQAKVLASDMKSLSNEISNPKLLQNAIGYDVKFENDVSIHIGDFPQDMVPYIAAKFDISFGALTSTQTSYDMGLVHNTSISSFDARGVTALAIIEGENRFDEKSCVQIGCPIDTNPSKVPGDEGYDRFCECQSFQTAIWTAIAKGVTEYVDSNIDAMLGDLCTAQGTGAIRHDVDEFLRNRRRRFNLSLSNCSTHRVTFTRTCAVFAPRGIQDANHPNYVASCTRIKRHHGDSKIGLLTKLCEENRDRAHPQFYNNLCTIARGSLHLGDISRRLNLVRDSASDVERSLTDAIRDRELSLVGCPLRTPMDIAAVASTHLGQGLGPPVVPRPHPFVTARLDKPPGALLVNTSMFTEGLLNELIRPDIPDLPDLSAISPQALLFAYGALVAKKMVEHLVQLTLPHAGRAYFGQALVGMLGHNNGDVWGDCSHLKKTLVVDLLEHVKPTLMELNMIAKAYFAECPCFAAHDRRLNAHYISGALGSWTLTAEDILEPETLIGRYELSHLPVSEDKHGRPIVCRVIPLVAPYCDPPLAADPGTAQGTVGQQSEAVKFVMIWPKHPAFPWVCPQCGHAAPTLFWPMPGDVCDICIKEVGGGHPLWNTLEHAWWLAAHGLTQDIRSCDMETILLDYRALCEEVGKGPNFNYKPNYGTTLTWMLDSPALPPYSQGLHPGDTMDLSWELKPEHVCVDVGYQSELTIRKRKLWMNYASALGV